MAPHLDCESDEARVARAVAAASLAIWGVGFPLFLGLFIHRFSSNPKFSFVIVSYGYKPTLHFWEAWECMKKFAILLIITFLRFFPELAAISLLVFLCFALVVSAVCEPFISSLINKAHLACDFLIIFVLLTGLLSTSAGRMWPREVETVSIVVVSYAACVLAGLVAILWLETGSMFDKGGRRHALWESFLQSSPARGIVSTAKRMSGIMGLRLDQVVPAPAALNPNTSGGQSGSVQAAPESCLTCGQWLAVGNPDARPVPSAMDGPGAIFGESGSIAIASLLGAGGNETGHRH